MDRHFLDKIAQVPLGEYVWIKYYGKYREWKVLYASINALGDVTFNVELRDDKDRFIVSRQYLLSDVNHLVFFDSPPKVDLIDSEKWKKIMTLGEVL